MQTLSTTPRQLPRRAILHRFAAAVCGVTASVLAACGAVPAASEPPEVRQYGPQITPAELRQRTFDALWSHLESDYIYFERPGTSWSALRARYSDRLVAVSSGDEFRELIADLQDDVPTGAFSWETRSERIENDVSASATYAGIGAFVAFSEDPLPHIIILDVMNGSPAQAAGLRAHDSILGIDDEPITAEEGLGAVGRVRGLAGTSVRLRILTPGRAARTVTVDRAEVTGDAALSYGTVAGTDVGYMLFPAVAYEGLAEDVVSSMAELTSNRRLSGLILDLRIAGSVSDWPLQELLTMFGSGIFGEFYSRGESRPVSVTGQDVLSSQSVPLVILVGQHTSGFPEVLAAGLSVTRRAMVIGQTTSGSVETSSVSYLPDGSRLYVETASFRPIGGAEIGETGLIPDVVVDAGWDEILPRADPLIDAAMQALAIPG